MLGIEEMRQMATSIRDELALNRSVPCACCFSGAVSCVMRVGQRVRSSEELEADFKERAEILNDADKMCTPCAAYLFAVRLCVELGECHRALDSGK